MFLNPWQYAVRKYMTEDGLALLYPDAFFAGNLQINQLTELVAELDLACDEMKSRMEQLWFCGLPMLNSEAEFDASHQLMIFVILCCQH